VKLTLTVPAQFFGIDVEGYLALTTDPSDPPNGRTIVFIAPSLAIRPAGVLVPFDQPTEEIVQGSAPVPDDVAAWIRGLQYLGITAERPTRVAGHPAVAFDYVIEQLPAEPETSSGGQGFFTLVGFAREDIIHLMPEGSAGSLYVVDAPDGTVLIQYGGPSGELETYKPTAEAIIASLSIG
jgi:hypothetical protein